MTGHQRCPCERSTGMDRHRSVANVVHDVAIALGVRGLDSRHHQTSSLDWVPRMATSGTAPHVIATTPGTCALFWMASAGLDPETIVVAHQTHGERSPRRDASDAGRGARPGSRPWATLMHWSQRARRCAHDTPRRLHAGPALRSGSPGRGDHPCRLARHRRERLRRDDRAR